MAALLAWAIHWHWRGGLAAGVVLAAADLLVRTDVSQGNYGNVFLLVIGGPIVGFICESLELMARERDAAHGRRSRARNGPGSRAPCTTGCSRCWRWSSGAVVSWPPSTRSSASSDGWRASRSRPCASLIRQQDAHREPGRR